MNKSINPSEFTSCFERALCILHNWQIDSSNEPWLTAAEISKRLREVWGLSCHWRTISTELDKDKTLVARRKRNHRWQYFILEKGKEIVGRTENLVTLIDPKNAVQHTSTLHDHLETLEGRIHICDPYLDSSTLEHLDSCSKDTEILLLTHNIQDTGRLRQLILAYPATGKRIEVKKTQKATLHDRYIIDKKNMFVLGTSLNGYGKKECFVIKVGQDIRKLTLDSFKGHWDKALVWPQ